MKLGTAYVPPAFLLRLPCNYRFGSLKKRSHDVLEFILRPLALFVFAFLWHAQSLSEPTTVIEGIMDNPKTQEHTDRATAKADASPIPSQSDGGSPVNPKPKPGARKSNCCRKLRHAPMWIEAACAVALVGITGAYTYFAREQARIANRTLGEIIKQYPEIQKSANAAKSASDTTAKALEENKRQFSKTLKQIEKQTAAQGRSAEATLSQLNAFKSSQRAILEMSATWDEPKQEITFTLKNIGQSTATEISMVDRGGGCRTVRESHRHIGIPQEILREMMTPIHSNSGGFSLVAHGEPWTRTQSGPTVKDSDASWDSAPCMYEKVGYKDGVGDEGHTYACMFWNQIRKRWERCYVYDVGKP